MINISCWKLKCDTDKNRAISKVILFDDIDGYCCGIFNGIFLHSMEKFLFFHGIILLDIYTKKMVQDGNIAKITMI